MAKKSRSEADTESVVKAKSKKPDPRSKEAQTGGVNAATALQLAQRTTTQGLRSTDVMHLQRTVGNRAAEELLESQSKEAPAYKANQPHVATMGLERSSTEEQVLQRQLEQEKEEEKVEEKVEEEEEKKM
jgi:hypothetical protein